MRMKASVLVCLLTMLLAAKHINGDCAVGGQCSAAAPSGDPSPYSVLGVATDANQESIVQAYRSLARRWHPDRHSGDGKAFATIAQAYDVLRDPEKREIFDRLGVPGLEQLARGDPTVKKGWLPPDEVLRRSYNDPPEPWSAWLVTSLFSSLAWLTNAASEGGHRLQILLGLESVSASVHITATDASGKVLPSGGATSGRATFKFALSGPSSDFVEEDIVHENCTRARFFGFGSRQKSTYYLECGHSSAARVSVSVAGNTFTVAGKGNTASTIFIVLMNEVSQ